LLLKGLIPALTKEQTDQAVAWCSRHYVSKGVTTTVITGTNKGKISYLKRAGFHMVGDQRVVMTSCPALRKTKEPTL
jgi:hypothetical protein